MSLNLNRNITGLLLSFIAFVWSCEQVSDLPDSGQNVEMPVIEATITNKNEVQRVKISYTSSLNSNMSRPVENALVRVWTNAGDTFIFLHQDSGEYQSESFAVEFGKIYTLTVETPDFKAVAVSEAMPVNPIDSLYCRLKNIKSSSYHVFLNAGTVDPVTVRYYLIQAYKQGKLLTKGDEIWLIEDKFLDDLNNLELLYDFHAGDTLDFELQSLTKPLFNYYTFLQNLFLNNQLFSHNYRLNPPVLFTGNVLGYFQVSMVSRKRIIIPGVP